MKPLSVNKVISNTDNEIQIQKRNNFLKKAKEIASQKVNTSIEDLKKRNADAIANFDYNSWNAGRGYECTYFTDFTKHLEGLETGLYVFAGESNSGKTATMMNIFYDLVLNEENHLYGVYFSLDDSKNEIFPRVIAMQKNVPIGCVKKPQLYTEFANEKPEMTDICEKYLERREEGIALLKEQSEKFTILDITDQESLNDKTIYNFIKGLKDELIEKDEKANIIIAIDAIDDIRLSDKVDDVSYEVAKRIKNMAVELGIVIFVSKHFRKLGANRRPMLDDLKESNELIYQASITFLVFNDVSKNKGNAQVYAETEDGEKLPIIELDWAKNKKSSYKGVDFFNFTPDFSQLIQCTQDETKILYNALYSN